MAQSFNPKLYQSARKELNGKKAQAIIASYLNNFHLKGYDKTFLATYYSPLYSVINQFCKNVKNKSVLEIGFRVPMFLDFLKEKGAKVYGIDIEPYMTNDNLLKMSIEALNSSFMVKHKQKFDIIFERITLTRLYDEQHFLKEGKYVFKNKEKVLSNIANLLKHNGLLILQDDRGSIFSETLFAKLGFEKVMKEEPVIFKDKKGKSLGWNVIVAYKKTGK